MNIKYCSKDDPLSPNMIVSPKYIIIVLLNISKIKIKYPIIFILFIHLMVYYIFIKFCSSVINIMYHLSILRLDRICKKLDININNDFINGIKSEIKRLENFLYS